MPYTSEQEGEFKRQFAARRKRQLLLSVPLVVAIIAVAILGKSDRQEILGVPAAVVGPAFVVLVLGALIFSLINWRCPACSGYLGKKISPRFCSKCGVVLQ
jgi:hypothetical protein